MSYIQFIQSRSNASKTRKEPFTVNCEFCNNEFTVTKTGLPPKTCSPSCYRKRINLLTRQRRKNPETRRRELDQRRKYRKKNKSKLRTSSFYYSSLRDINIKESIVDLTDEEILQISLVYKYRHHLNQIHGRNSYHVDHIIPLSRGGTHHPDNLQIIPRSQNIRKRDRTPEEYERDFGESLTPVPLPPEHGLASAGPLFLPIPMRMILTA